MDYLLLVALLEQGKEEDFLSLLEGEDLVQLLRFKGWGQAEAGMLSLLYINEIKKDVYLALLPGPAAARVQGELDYQRDILHQSWGVTFLIPLRSLQGSFSRKEELMAYKNSAILILVDQAQARALVDRARAAGAQGATVVAGQGSGWSEDQKESFLVTIQPDQVLILILMPAQEEGDFLEEMGDDLRAWGAFYLTLPVGSLGGLTKGL